MRYAQVTGRDIDRSRGGLICAPTWKTAERRFVGATVTGDGRAHDLSRLNGPILAPGFGAQGGTAADLAEVFGSSLPRVLASTSRDVLGAGPSPAGLRDAASRALDAVVAVLR